MSMTIPVAAIRIADHVTTAEAGVDQAMIAVANLIATVLQARRETGVEANTGQCEVVRLVRAQSSLVTASSDVLRVHKRLADLHRTVAGGDIHQECLKPSAIYTDARSQFAVVG